MLYVGLASLVVGTILLRSSSTLPVENSQLPGDKNTINDDYIIIDQRQNGTDNIRVNIDGVIIALTPIEALFGGSLEDFDFLEEFDITTKPNEGSSTTESSSTTINSILNSTLARKKFKRRRNGVSQLMRTLLGHRRLTSKDN